MQNAVYSLPSTRQNMLSRSFIHLSVLSTVLVFSLIVLGIAASLISTTQSTFGVTFNYASLAVATAVITIILIVPMIILEFLQPDGITSMIIFEICSLMLFWILWLATASRSARADTLFTGLFGNCNDNSQ
ncbi:hypothetical protein B0H11DRAFT_67938 [Mycena galericulata]|nr:hypothetical protein B0H11DRAFT_67938 [Mycena galericulata]